MPLKKVLEITKRVLSIIIWTLFGIILTVVAWLAIDKFIIGSPVPSMFGYATLTIETGSMSGTIEEGDMILIKDTGEYKIGDIVTFLQEGDKIPTTHRIINYDINGNFITRGDANNAADTTPVKQNEILGEVIHVFPKVGHFSDWVKMEGWIYIVAILGILAIGIWISKPDHDDDEEEKEVTKEENENEKTSSSDSQEDSEDSTTVEENKEDNKEDNKEE